jgi:hypothetical protein
VTRQGDVSTTSAFPWRDLAAFPARGSIVAYGVRIGLGADHPVRLEGLKSVMPAGARERPCRVHDVSYGIQTGKPAAGSNLDEVIGYVDREEVARVYSYPSVLRALERHVKLYVAEHAPRRVFVHAGVVAWRGRGILIPGTSGSGKSTLVAAWLRAGATYYSDEYAIVDSLGRVYPYLQPIQLRFGDGGSVEIPPAEFPAPVGRYPLRVRLVLVTRHREEACWRPRRVSRGEGMLSLMANTVSARRDPRRALHSLSGLLTDATVLKGVRGDAETTVRRLIDSRCLDD